MFSSPSRLTHIHVFFYTTAGEIITQKSKSMRTHTSGTSSMNRYVRPQSVTSRSGFTSAMAEQQEYSYHDAYEFLPPLRGGAMPASRNPFRRSSDSATRMRPLSSSNPFDAAIKAVEETSSKSSMSTTTRPLFLPRHRQSPLSPTSLSLKGDEIRRLLAANQNGSIASSPLSMSTSGMMSSKNPFAFVVPERISSRDFPSLSSRRGLKLPQGHMMESSVGLVNDFSFHSPTVVGRPSSRHAGNKQCGDLFYTRGLKRASDESSYSDDSSCGSRKQARRLNAMHVSDRTVGGFDRFRKRDSFDQHLPPSPVASQRVPQVIKTLPIQSRTAQPLRFFNNGVEVDINGNPITPKHDECSLPRLDSEPEEQADLDTLQSHQKSVWDEFTETPEQREAREKKKKSRRKRATEEQAKPLNLPVDPTESEFSDPKKLATAQVDDLVRDSLKEREKTLSAASVLMGFAFQSPIKEKEVQ